VTDDIPDRFRGEALGPEQPVVGRLRTVSSLDDTERIADGDVVYLSPAGESVENMLLFAALVRNGAGAVLTGSIGSTDHGVIVANEMGIPCVRGIPPTIGAHETDRMLVDGDEVRIGEADGPVEDVPRERPIATHPVDAHLRVNLGFPDVVDRRPAVVDAVDGVGFMRLEFVMLDVLEGCHPFTFVERNSADELAGLLAERIERVLDAFAPRPVRIRTDDLPVNLLWQMDGGEHHETREQYPMMGHRGISRSIADPRLIGPQFEAIRRTLERGHRNVGLFPPMTRFPSEYRTWKRMALDAGLGDVTFGVMVETPSAALRFEELASEVEFAIFGTNDLTQFTLAVDRSNEHLEETYAADSPAVLALVEQVVDCCTDHGIESSIGGRAASDPALVEALLELGISGFSVVPNPRTVEEMYARLAAHERGESP